MSDGTIDNIGPAAALEHLKQVIKREQDGYREAIARIVSNGMMTIDSAGNWHPVTKDDILREWLIKAREVQK